MDAKKLFVLAVGLFFTVNTVFAYTPGGSIRIDPARGEAGDEVNVSGSGFTESTKILWNGVNVNGDFYDDKNLAFIVPDNASQGRNEVVVDYGAGKRSLPVLFTVTSTATLPDDGPSCPTGYKCPNNRTTCNASECITNSSSLPTDGGDGNNNDNNNNNNNSGVNNNPNNPLGPFPGEDLSFQDVLKIVNGFVCWLLNIATTVMVIFLVWAGFLFMTAGANPTKQQEAIKNFKSVLWGILVIFAAGVIISTVGTLFGWKATAFIPLVC